MEFSVMDTVVKSFLKEGGEYGYFLTVEVPHRDVFSLPGLAIFHLPNQKRRHGHVHQ
jgi:hypothetical protein